MNSRYSDADYLSWDPFADADRDVDIRCRSVKVVTVRKEHKCLGDDGPDSMHEITAGTRARVERALIDGEWGSYYICTACMDAWLADRNIQPNSDSTKQ